jgi:hypothetical protein
MAEKTVLQPPPPRALTGSDGKVSAHFYQWLQSMQQGVESTIAALFKAATSADYWSAATGALALTPDAVWASTGYVALTDAATITVDMATGFNFNVSIAADRALGNPTNAKVGQSGCFKVTASGGARNLTVGGNYKKTADVAFPVNIASGQTAYVFYFVDTSSRILITAVVNNPA